MKIFGIGLGKTGTWSLQKALDMLGYPGIHCPMDVETITAVENKLDLTSVTLKAIDDVASATDVPIANLFRQLDVGYPGSKFILTLRENMTDWLASCLLHYEVRHNRSRKAKIINRMIYDCITFDEEKFAYAYVRHKREVLEYFRGRPKDLLLLDVLLPDPMKWESLCQFLNEPIPAVRYPHKNVRRHTVPPKEEKKKSEREKIEEMKPMTPTKGFEATKKNAVTRFRRKRK
jgi:hypothetical protein